MQRLHSTILCLVFLFSAGTGIQGCTILGFTNHSFSANVVRLLHSLPIFEGQNGTVYLDSTSSSHKCHADGGFHEFFNLGKHAVPWTAEAEAAEPSTCARYSLGDIDNVVHGSGLSWEELTQISIRRIWHYQPWLKTMLLEVLRTLEGSEKPIIAIHVKAHGSTPVQKHLAIQPQEYMDMFVKTFPHVKQGTCIVAGGSEAQNEKTQEMAAQLIGCKAFNRSELHVQEGDPQKVPHASWKAHCLMTRNLLFDLELLAHADYFVGTTKSGLSPIIETMRYTLYGKNRRTFLAHGGDWYERIREYFREHHVMPI